MLDEAVVTEQANRRLRNGIAIAALILMALQILAANGIFKYVLPAPYVGVELYIKLQSFNVFGGGMQNLSNCTAYTYTPSGAAFDHPAAEAMLTATVLDFGSVTTAPGVDDDFGTPFTLSIEDFIDLGNATAFEVATTEGECSA